MVLLAEPHAVVCSLTINSFEINTVHMAIKLLLIEESTYCGTLCKLRDADTSCKCKCCPCIRVSSDAWCLECLRQLCRVRCAHWSYTVLQQSTIQSLLCCQSQKAASGFWDSLGMWTEMHSAPNQFDQYTVPEALHWQVQGQATSLPVPIVSVACMFAVCSCAHKKA